MSAQAEHTGGSSSQKLTDTKSWQRQLRVEWERAQRRVRTSPPAASVELGQVADKLLSRVWLNDNTLGERKLELSRGMWELHLSSCEAAEHDGASVMAVHELLSEIIRDQPMICGCLSQKIPQLLLLEQRMRAGAGLGAHVRGLLLMVGAARLGRDVDLYALELLRHERTSEIEREIQAQLGRSPETRRQAEISARLDEIGTWAVAELEQTAETPEMRARRAARTGAVAWLVELELRDIETLWGGREHQTLRAEVSAALSRAVARDESSTWVLTTDELAAQLQNRSEWPELTLERALNPEQTSTLRMCLELRRGGMSLDVALTTARAATRSARGESRKSR